MGVILDTSVLIAAERGSLRFPAFLDTLGDEPVAMAAITAAELLHGYHRADDAGIRARRAAFVEAIIDIIPVLPFGLQGARRHAETWADLARAGTVVGPHDLLIAATALAHGYSVATLNRREFAHVHGLRLVRLEKFFDTY
jgi:tRNA(fMet)-specific endonuclease VapC